MSARTITTRLALEGESEYKSKIKNLNTELALHKSQLEKVQAQYQNNSGSMDALTGKQSALKDMLDTLNKKHGEQAAMLDKAREAQEKFAAQADELRGQLDELKNSSEDTTEEEQRLREELAQAEDNMQKAANTAMSYQKQLNNTERDQANLRNELDKCAGAMDEFGRQAEDAGGKAESAGEDSKVFGEKAAGAMDQLAQVLAAAGIAAAVKEIADTLYDCSNAAAAFETSIAKVSTIADPSKASLEDIKGSILELSGETGKSAESLAEATYSAISAGVDTASSVAFVGQAAKLAAGGFTDAETAVDVLTTALNAYDLSVGETERVSDILITTQNKGKTTVDQLAQSMGGVIPLAAAYGVEMDNLGTAYAVLTANGDATAEAGTKLKAMLSELGDSGSTVAGVLKEKTGQSFADLTTGGSSLGDVLAILGDSVGGNAAAFAELWSSTEAGVGALSLFNSGADNFNSVLTSMQDSAGATSDAYGKMADTTEFAQQRMTASLDNLKIAIGSQLNPALEKLYDMGANAFSWATDFVNENPAVVKAVAAVVIGLGTLAVGVTAVTAAGAALNAVMAANPIGLMAAAATAAVAAIGSFVFMMTSASEETKEFTNSLQESKEAYEELSETMAEEQESTAASAAALEELLAVEEKSAAQKAAISELVNQLNESVPGLNIAYNEERDALEGLTAAEVTAMVEKAAAQEEYEAQVSRLSELYTEQSEIAARLQAAQDALSEAQETGSGNTRTLENDIKELTAAQEENAAQIAELEEASREYGEMQAEAAAKTQEMTTRVEDITGKMESLQAAYEESYNAARESIDQQLGLFEELDGSAKTSVSSLIDTLKGQVSYMETYAANIQKAMELGVDEGLVRKLSDGSEESAQILDSIVQGGEEDIKALNDEFRKVEEGKEDFAKTVAEMETDFNEKMEALVKDLDDAIQDMDLADDAYSIGANNMQGLINGTVSRKQELVNKYAEMGRAALAAYKREVGQMSPSKKFAEAGRYDIQGIINGAKEKEAALGAAYEDAARTALKGMRTYLPSTIEPPTPAAAMRNQAEALKAVVSDRVGAGAQPIQVYVDKLEVREDADVERVAQKLYYLTEREKRRRGGGSL